MGKLFKGGCWLWDFLTFSKSREKLIHSLCLFFLNVFFSPEEPDDVRILEKYAFSNAISASVKLGMLEAKLDRLIDSIDFVTSDLKKGKIHMTQVQFSKFSLVLLFSEKVRKNSVNIITLTCLTIEHPLKTSRLIHKV